MDQTNQFDMRSIKALIVDDHDPIRKAMRRVLVSLGIQEITECFDGEDAGKTLHKHPDFDLVLCDIYMRKVNGFDVLETVRNRSIRSDIPFIIVTGESNKDDIIKASDLGADDYMIKPFQADALAQKVQQVLTRFFSPSPLYKLLRHGDRLLLAKQYTAALESYQAAIKMEPGSLRAKHSVAVALEGMDFTEEAIRIHKENIQASNVYYRSYASLADIYLKRKLIAEAITAMRKELEYHPKQVDRQVQLARLLLDGGDVRGAMEHFRAALKEKPRHKTALLGMGKAFDLEEDPDKAIYYFRRLRRHYPMETDALKAIVKSALKAKEPKKAEMVLRDERKTHPDRLDTYIVLAQFFLAIQDLENAEATLKDLLKKHPTHAQALKMLAGVYLRKKDFVHAETWMQKALAEEQSIENYLIYADCLLKTKKYKPCIDTLHKILAEQRDNPKAVYLLATAHRHSKQYTKAQLLYRRAGTLGAEQEPCNKMQKVCNQARTGRLNKKTLASSA